MAHFILAETSASITELKTNPSKVVKAGEGGPVAILNKNVPEFYCIPADAYATLLDRLEDLELSFIARERLNDGEKPVKTSIEELRKLYGSQD